MKVLNELTVDSDSFFTVRFCLFLGENYEREDISPGGRTQDDNSASKRNCALVLACQVTSHLHVIPCYHFAPENGKTTSIRPLGVVSSVEA